MCMEGAKKRGRHARSLLPSPVFTHLQIPIPAVSRPSAVVLGAETMNAN